MAYVYRYIDKADGIIKYVGIVWGESRTLKDRIREHKNDPWNKNINWLIQYITANINTRTDAEYFEAHYVSLYGTDKYFNKSKAGWGTSSFLPNREEEWVNYSEQPPITNPSDYRSDENISLLFDEIINSDYENKPTIYDKYIKMNCADSIGRVNHKKKSEVDHLLDRKLTLFITRKQNRIDPGPIDVINREMYQFEYDKRRITVHIPHMNIIIFYDLNTDTYSIGKQSNLTYIEMCEKVKEKIDSVLSYAHAAEEFYNIKLNADRID